jgi:hypothetical protein
MAGAFIQFEGGWLGFERCEGKDDGKQFLRAVIYNESSGRRTSAAVPIEDAASFCKQLMKQICLAHINAKDDDALVDLALTEMVDKIRNADHG